MGLGIFLFLEDDRSNLLPDKENHVGIVQYRNVSPTEQCFRIGIAKDSSGSARQTASGVARPGLERSSLETFICTMKDWITEDSECLKILLQS